MATQGVKLARAVVQSIIRNSDTISEAEEKIWRSSMDFTNVKIYAVDPRGDGYRMKGGKKAGFTVTLPDGTPVN